MIERRQSHHVDYARPEDLDEIERLHVESQQFRSPHGTPYVNPLDRSQLDRLLPRTLLLRHREVIIGKLHTVPVAGEADTLQIGGFRDRGESPGFPTWPAAAVGNPGSSAGTGLLAGRRHHGIPACPRTIPPLGRHNHTRGHLHIAAAAESAAPICAGGAAPGRVD